MSKNCVTICRVYPILLKRICTDDHIGIYIAVQFSESLYTFKDMDYIPCTVMYAVAVSVP